MHVRGVDISFHQNLAVGNPDRREIDFALMKLNADFAIFRAGQNLWADREFLNYRKQARLVGLPHGSYFFYDSRADPKKQAQLWVNVLGNDLGELPLFPDLEDNYGGAWSGWRHWNDFLEELKRLVPGKAIYIYTGPSYWKENTLSKGIPSVSLEYFKQYPLWIANYGVTTPLIPRPWDTWTFWQTTDKGDARKYGVYDSKSIDENYFNGTKEEFARMFGLDEYEIPPPPQSGGGITIRMGRL
jgi:lysozyme